MTKSQRSANLNRTAVNDHRLQSDHKTSKVSDHKQTRIKTSASPLASSLGVLDNQRSTTRNPSNFNDYPRCFFIYLAKNTTQQQTNHRSHEPFHDLVEVVVSVEFLLLSTQHARGVHQRQLLQHRRVHNAPLKARQELDQLGGVVVVNVNAVNVIVVVVRVYFTMPPRKARRELIFQSITFRDLVGAHPYNYQSMLPFFSRCCHRILGRRKDFQEPPSVRCRAPSCRSRRT